MPDSPVIISLGGSLICPDALDEKFLRRFTSFINEQVQQGRRFVIVVGGGKLARNYQLIYRTLSPDAHNTIADWIGIQATRLNAQLLQGVLAPHITSCVISDPENAVLEDGIPVYVSGGWKPGFSTDRVTVMFAEKTGASMLLNLSNIRHVYEKDPTQHPDARAISTIGWKKFLEMVGNHWEPGNHLPFDPIASQKAMEIGLKVIIADGRNFDNICAILEKQPFVGTEIGPE